MLFGSPSPSLFLILRGPTDFQDKDISAAMAMTLYYFANARGFAEKIRMMLAETGMVSLALACRSASSGGTHPTAPAFSAMEDI